MKINAAYIRVSSSQTARPGRRVPQEASLGRQTECLTARHITLALLGPLRFFSDDLTGRIPERKQLMKLIKQIEVNLVAHLLLWDGSRLARNNWLFQQMLSLCWHHGIPVWIETWERWVNWGDPHDRFLLGMTGMFNEQFSIGLGRDVREAKDRMLRQGCSTSRPPYGMVRGEDKHLKPIPDRWAVVQRIFQEIWTYGVRRITQRLEVDRRAGLIPGWGPDGSIPWTPYAVRLILGNPAYTGSLVGHRMAGPHKKFLPRAEWVIVPNAHPAILTWEEFDTVQGLLASRVIGAPFKTRMRSPLARRIVCGHHTCRLTAGRREGTEFLLRCRCLWCPNNGTPVSVVEQEMQSSTAWAMKVGPHTDAGIVQLRETTQAELATREHTIRDLKERLEHLASVEPDLVLRQVRNELTESAFERELQTLRNDAIQIRTRLLELENWCDGKRENLRQAETDHQRWTAVGRLEVLPLDQKRELLMKLVKRVVLYERTRVEVEYVKEEE